MASEGLTVLDPGTIERVLLDGDLSKLTIPQRLAYYLSICETLGLNPTTRPFEYIVLSGKLVLYARREATEQFRKLHGVSLTITAREVVEDTYIVTARAEVAGRTDESIGAKAIGNLKGEARANAMMTAETKAKRRVTLSICGLGFLDETEVVDIPPGVVARPAMQIPPPAPIPKPDPVPPPPPPAAVDELDIKARDQWILEHAMALPPLQDPWVRIVEIREAKTRNAGVTRHSVILSNGLEVTTINPWYASLAQHARETQTPVIVRTKKTKYGDQIEAIESDPTVEPTPMLAAGDIPF